MNEVTVRRQARKQLRALLRIEKRGNVLIQKFSRFFTRSAKRALREGSVAVLEAKEMNALQDELVDYMVYASFEQRKINRRKPQPNIELTSFSKELKATALSFDLDLDDVRNSFVELAGSKMDDAILFQLERVNDSLANISAQGLTTRSATQELTRRLSAMGLTATRANTVETLVRTHAQFAYNATQWKIDQESGLIWGYQYSAVGDDRTRPEHLAVDGIVRRADDDFWKAWWPPNGWNCRCQAVAILDPERQSRVPQNKNPDEGFEFNLGADLIDDQI